MPWFKVDDGFWSHPKVIELSPASVALWVRAGSYSAQHLTDGFVSRSVVRILGHASGDADSLVEAGLWDGKPDGKPAGYQFHDWGNYQPPSIASKEKRDELSRKRAESGRKGAEARWSQDALQTDGNSDGKLPSTSDGNAIAPSRPVPSRPEASKEASSSGKKPETRMPDDWAPTVAHFTRARDNNIDIAKEVESFKLFSETHDRHAANWNAAFTTWLIKAKPSDPVKRNPDAWMNP